VVFASTKHSHRPSFSLNKFFDLTITLTAMTFRGSADEKTSFSGTVSLDSKANKLIDTHWWDHGPCGLDMARYSTGSGHIHWPIFWLDYLAKSRQHGFLPVLQRDGIISASLQCNKVKNFGKLHFTGVGGGGDG
jgi:hypothetical protein